MNIIILTCSLQMVILLELLLCPDVYGWFEGLGDVVFYEARHKLTISWMTTSAACFPHHTAPDFCETNISIFSNLA